MLCVEVKKKRVQVEALRACIANGSARRLAGIVPAKEKARGRRLFGGGVCYLFGMRARVRALARSGRRRRWDEPRSEYRSLPDRHSLLVALVSSPPAAAAGQLLGRTSYPPVATAAETQRVPGNNAGRHERKSHASCLSASSSSQLLLKVAKSRDVVVQV